MALTISEAAALINVATIIVKLSYPLLFALIAVGSLRTETNAATWSVFGRLINDSLWPAILQTDAASSSKVQRRTSALAWLSTIAGVMLAISAAITPLGLHTIEGGKTLNDVTFEYVKDTVSPIGRATPSRIAYKSNRVCFGGQIPCPGSNAQLSDGDQRNGPWFNQSFDQVSSDIAANITDIFRGGSDAESGTVASSMDIQWRSYINYNDNSFVDESRPRTQADFRYLQDFKLANSVQAIEGLLVSTRDDIGRGVAFRNHTFPVRSEESIYTWTEDLLWLEPVTSCTDLNITFEYNLPSRTDYNASSAARLVDRGGFVGYPTNAPVPTFQDTQNDPQLLARSWTMATLTNGALRKVLNETQNMTRLGKEYPLSDILGPYSASNSRPGEIALHNFGSTRDDPPEYDPGLPAPLTAVRRSDLNFSAPAAVFLETYIQPLVDTADIGEAGVVGGILLGAGIAIDEAGDPIPLDQQSSSRLAAGSNWSQPLYACVSTIRASVKTVRFQHSGVGGTESLVVRDVTPSNQTHLWGMENYKLAVEFMDPFWGIVSSEEDLANVAVLDRASFHLPETRSSSSPFGWGGIHGSAGVEAPYGFLRSMYSGTLDPDSGEWGQFSGGSNAELSDKWFELSRNASTAGRIIDTIWTDGIANSVVATQSPLLQADGTALPSYTRSVTQNEQVVSYKWRYAIPALIFAACYVVLLGFTFVLSFRKHVNLAYLRVMLDQTSAGRAVTTERYGTKNQIDLAKTKEWATVRGDEVVRLSSVLRGGKGESHPGESLLAHR